MTDPPPDPHPPAGLAGVLPAAALALGIDLGCDPGIVLPPARHVVVVMLDGLGELLLARRIGHAPFLREVRAGAGRSQVLRCGFPATTATSMATLGTATATGTHGLVGTDVLDPARGVMFSELSWDPLVDPRRWQPHPTVFQRLTSRGVDVVRIGPGHFDGSGLTEAALRGGRFAPAAGLGQCVDAAVTAVQRAGPRPGLTFLYWGEIDKVGHEAGCGSWQWGEALAAADAALAQLVERLPPSTLVLVTADHGMVDVPFQDRLDVAHDPELEAGVRFVGGEPRGIHLYCRDGAAQDVLTTWRERLGPRMDLLMRAEAIAEGWFGAVDESVRTRIGDVVGTARDAFAVVDSRTARPQTLALLGQHGALEDSDQLVPLLSVLA